MKIRDIHEKYDVEWAKDPLTFWQKGFVLKDKETGETKGYVHATDVMINNTMDTEVKIHKQPIA